MQQQQQPHSQGPLSDAVVSALYVARCRDCGLQPMQSAARRFHAEVAAAQQYQTTTAAAGGSPRGRGAAARTGGSSDPATSLYLPSMRLGVRSAQLLSRGVSRPSAVHLHGNPGLGDAGAQALLPLLEHGTCRSLDLGNCGLGPAFAPALARYLIRVPSTGSALERLELGGATASGLQKPNQLRGIGALATVLQHHCPRLCALGLSHSRVGATDEAEGCVQALASLAVQAPALTALDVAANDLGRASLPLLQLLPLCFALTELDLSGNHLADWGAQALADALVAAVAGGDELAAHVHCLTGAAATIAAAKLGEARGRQQMRNRHCALRSLALAGNHIHAVGARMLALAVSACASLRSLSLADNPIGDDGAAALARAIVAPSADGAPAEATPACTQLNSLNLSGCQLGAAGAQALAGAVSADRFASLRIARNVLTEEGVATLARALRTTSTLTTLDVSGCRISDRSALQLVSAVTRTRGCPLQSLKLHDNALSDHGGQALLTALSLKPRPAPSTAPPRAPSWEQHAQPADGAAPADVDGAAHALGGGEGGGGRGGLHSITVQGNQMSYATISGLKELCLANRQSEAVSADVTKGLMELAPCAPALELIEHQLTAERAQHGVAMMQLGAVEKSLAEARMELHTLLAEASAQHATATAEEADALQQVAAVAADREREEAQYEEERATLEAEVNQLLSRRSQLERLDRSPRARGRKPIELPPGVPEPPPLDEQLQALLEQEREKADLLNEQILRDKRAYYTMLWAEKQLDDINDVIARAKAKAQAKGGAKRR